MIRNTQTAENNRYTTRNSEMPKSNRSRRRQKIDQTNTSPLFHRQEKSSFSTILEQINDTPLTQEEKDNLIGVLLKKEPADTLIDNIKMQTITTTPDLYSIQFIVDFFGSDKVSHDSKLKLMKALIEYRDTNTSFFSLLYSSKLNELKSQIETIFKELQYFVNKSIVQDLADNFVSRLNFILGLPQRWHALYPFTRELTIEEIKLLKNAGVNYKLDKLNVHLMDAICQMDGPNDCINIECKYIVTKNAQGGDIVHSIWIDAEVDCDIDPRLKVTRPTKTAKLMGTFMDHLRLKKTEYIYCFIHTRQKFTLRVFRNCDTLMLSDFNQEMEAERMICCGDQFFDKPIYFDIPSILVQIDRNGHNFAYRRYLNSLEYFVYRPE